MAATFTFVAENPSPSMVKDVIYTMTGDTEYPANGYAADFSARVGTIYEVRVTALSHTTTETGQYVGDYDVTAGKIVLRDVTNSAAQVTTSTDLSATTFRVVVKGKESK